MIGVFTRVAAALTIPFVKVASPLSRPPLCRRLGSVALGLARPLRTRGQLRAGTHVFDAMASIDVLVLDIENATTKTPKKRRREGMEVGSLAASVCGQKERDIGFVLQELRAADAGLAAYIAGLLRD